MHAVRAAETPILAHMEGDDGLEGFVASLAQLFIDAGRSIGSNASSLHLCLAVLMPISQLASPLLDHLSADHKGTTVPQVQVNAHCEAQSCARVFRVVWCSWPGMSYECMTGLTHVRPSQLLAGAVTFAHHLQGWWAAVASPGCSACRQTSAGQQAHAPGCQVPCIGAPALSCPDCCECHRRQSRTLHPQGLAEGLLSAEHCQLALCIAVWIHFGQLRMHMGDFVCLQYGIDQQIAFRLACTALK